MWLLECDGDLFDRKRIWLRPGSVHILGRTKPDSGASPSDNVHILTGRTISRQHLIISVDYVEQDEDPTLPTSVVSVRDNDTKFGTILDEEQLGKNNTRTLTSGEHTIRLGKDSTIFRVSWQPVVLTFASGTETRAQQPILRQVDIRTSLDFIKNHTTHVVSSKRNVPKVLQALVNAKPLVTQAFVDAVIRASTKVDDSDPNSPSTAPLENDFDSHWPNELDYLPPSGKEPKPRPAEMLKPLDQRAKVFAGYTFVFGDRNQYENLAEPISDGGGKTLCHEVTPGETKFEDFVRVVKEAAGEKGLGEFEDGSEGKGVVVVRIGTRRNFEEWTGHFLQQVDLLLGQRSILQNEFLDAILLNDASGLRVPLHEEIEVTSSQPQPLPSTAPSAVQASRLEADGNTTIGPPIPSTKTRKPPRTRYKSKFRGFEGFDDESVVQSSCYSPEAASRNQPSKSIDSEIILESQSQYPSQLRTQTQVDTLNARKRCSPPSEDEVENERDVIDGLLQGAATMKRRRLERGKISNNEDHIIKLTEENGNLGLPKLINPRKLPPEVNVLELAQKRREEEEEAARRDAETLRNAMEGMDIEQMKNLAQVVEMDIIPRSDFPAFGDQEGTGCWDERWNGRKNFKKFRRRGDTRTLPRRPILVELEEVGKKGFGIGDEYWLDNSRSGMKDKSFAVGSSREASESQRQDEMEADTSFRLSARVRGARRKQSSPQAEGVEVDELITPARDQTLEVRAKQNSGTQQSQASPTQTMRSETQRATLRAQNEQLEKAMTAKGKRVAREHAPMTPPPNKQRRILEPDESEDDLKFRFRRRRN
ncbi:hypothetical protein M501DRAFT_1001319 [Patellaria atrata CBS 101060]|uniref:FHA domain-containing protein n=1 Tax=Patellaria atrata CBS 101060 TaxID=1346257 RepID=A0A9P4S3D0_9PEZI|nr:hypothetical protein M501DRAFT_1001319 [Patellaria atrata CBS 101060]